VHLILDNEKIHAKESTGKDTIIKKHMQNKRSQRKAEISKLKHKNY